MESLAFAVSIIMAIVLLSGPIAIGLTFIPRKTRAIYVVRRLWVLVFSFLGIIMSSQIILSVSGIGIKLFAISEIAVIVYALKREITLL
jgi:hypothetical protein